MEEVGNDTIDCYPSLERGIKKILIVSEQKFKELESDLKAFFQGLRGRPVSRSSRLKANSGQILQPQKPSEALSSKFGSKERFRDYEPTNAIHFNTCEWRRWVRVQEWFSQYAQGAEEKIFLKGVLYK